MASINKRPDRAAKPYTVRWREAGRNRRRSFVRRREAEAFLAEAIRIEAADKAGTYRRPAAAERLTVAEAAEQWLADSDLANATLNRRRSALTRWILPTIGNHRVADVTSGDLLTIRRKARDAGRSRATLANIHETSRLLFDHCLTHHGLTTNPAIAAGPPSRAGNSRRREPRPFTDSELARLIAAMPRPVDQRIVNFAVATGLRPGELWALPARLVDLEQSRVEVRYSRKADGAIGETKTSQVRVVPLSPRATIAAAAQLAENPTGEPRLFPVDAANWRRRRWDPAADAAGLDDRVPYDLRHTCASRLIAAGGDVRRVAAWLGHTQVKTTLDVYSHLLPGGLEALADLID